MRALITNDDGIDSPGLTVLAERAAAEGYEVVVAAPRRESSGASAALMGTEDDGRLIVERRSPPGLPDGIESFGVRATPALITLVAAHGGFGPPPDLVLSGINRGANTGHATLHSGTVGAALSASTHGMLAMAVSLNSADPTHWDTAGYVVKRALRWLLDNPDPTRVMNLNVPDRPVDQILGLRKAPLASFGMVHARIKEADHGHLTLTYTGTDMSKEPQSDAGLVARGWATVSLLRAPVADDDADLPHFEHEGAREHRMSAQRSRGEDDEGTEIIDTIDAGVMTGQDFPEP